MKKRLQTLILCSTMFLAACEGQTNEQPKITENTKTVVREIEVDGGNLSGDREANVMVDIGFGICCLPTLCA